MSSPISKKVDDANTLAKEYQTNFDGKYNSSPIERPVGYRDVVNILIGSRKRLGIIFGILYIAMIYYLYNHPPSYVYKKKNLPSDPQTVSVSSVLKYALLFSAFVFIVLCVVSYRVPMLKQYVYGECGMCRG